MLIDQAVSLLERGQSNKQTNTQSYKLNWSPYPRIDYRLLGYLFGGYSVKESGFGYIGLVNPNMDSVKKLQSINESESRF